MAIPTPPVGARVRHTTTYTDGTAVTVEGVVAPNANHNQTAEPYLLIGGELLVGYLVDRPGAYSVTVEVLEQPQPAESEHGYVGRAGTNIWERDDRAEWRGDTDAGKHWWRPGDDNPYTWHAVCEINRNAGYELVQLIPDPADNAPALPWNVEDNDEDSLVIQDAYAKGVAAMVSVNSGSVHLSPAVAREAARVLLRAAREFEEREAGAVVSETARTPTSGAAGWAQSRGAVPCPEAACFGGQA